MNTEEPTIEGLHAWIGGEPGVAGFSLGVSLANLIQKKYDPPDDCQHLIDSILKSVDRSANFDPRVIERLFRQFSLKSIKDLAELTERQVETIRGIGWCTTIKIRQGMMAFGCNLKGRVSCPKPVMNYAEKHGFVFRGED